MTIGANMTPEEIEEYGVLRFYSDYGNHKITVEIPGDADIHKVGEALKAFLLATDFSESTVSEILDVP